MNNTPFFSIIIPTYNSEKTLHKCLESIISQSFTDFEVLIIDGVSTDRTLEIAKNFNDTRIKILSEADQGIYDAMNKGIKMAKGEWLYFLGSDDKLYENNILTTITNYVIKNNCLVIYGNVISTRFNGVYAREFDYQKLYLQNICHQSIFFNKLIFKKIGFFNLKYRALADYEHNIRWFLKKSIPKLFIDVIIAEYADGGYSSTNDDKIFYEDRNFKFIINGYNSLPKEFLFKLMKKYVGGIYLKFIKFITLKS